MWLLIITLLFFLYSWLVLWCWMAWKKIPVHITSPGTATTRFSVIIPARNEEKNIGRLLTSLEKQDYPKHLWEVIVVDDHSTDQTATVVQQFRDVKLIRLREDNINSYKKEAIGTAIRAAGAGWIVTTDADCEVPAGWLRTLADFKEKHNSVFIASPVVIQSNKSVLQLFQAMDFMILQAITGAAVSQEKLSMCNGANIAYDKNAFFTVNGFSGIDHIASGDDMLLMHKISQHYPGRVHYLKSREATVSTLPATTWKAFFSQRIRWASKARKYKDRRITAVLLLVYLFNLSFAVLLAAGFFHSMYWLCAAGLWLLKTMAEWPLFYSASRFFEKPWANKLFFFFQPPHILYTIISGLFGQLGKYEWKGRKVR